MNTNTDDPAFKPPYIAFRTLLNLIQRMADNGAPPKIDRTFLSGSEGGKTQILAALRALGFIDAEGNVQPLLTEIVKNPDGRKTLMRELLEQHYPEPVRLGGINATQGQLQDAFKAYGISGDTMRKAIAFYLRAAEFADVPVSPNFKTPSVQRADGTAAKTTTKRRKTKVTNAGGGSGSANAASTPSLPSVHPGLAGVLADLPSLGQGWTVEQKESFMRAFTTMVDYSIPIVDEEDEVEEHEEDLEDDDELDG